MTVSDQIWGLWKQAGPYAWSAHIHTICHQGLSATKEVSGTECRYHLCVWHSWHVTADDRETVERIHWGTASRWVVCFNIACAHRTLNIRLRKSRDTYRNMAYNVDGRWMKYEFGALVEWYRQENRPAGSVTCPITPNSIINSTWIGLGLNPGFYSQRPETNHLSYEAAVFSLQFKCYQLPIFMVS